MSNTRFVLVDYLKGYSILTIILYHLLSSYPFPSILQKIFMFGGAGVHVFILCSGFGLYFSYLRKQLTYPQFLKKRFSKIYWPYVLVILLTAIWESIQTNGLDYLAIASHVFLFKMFFEEYENSYGEQMWFISTIIQFYLFWPLIVKLFSKKMVYAFAISFVWAFFVVAVHLEEYRVFNSFFLQYLWEFVVGMYLAQLYYRCSVVHLPETKKLVVWGIVGLSLVSISGITGGIWKSFNDLPSLLGYLCIAILCFKCSSRFLIKAFTAIGGFSYELYLVHVLVYSICKTWLDSRVGVCTEILICFVAALCVAYGYHKLIYKSKNKFIEGSRI